MDLFWKTLALAAGFVFIGNFLGKWLPLFNRFALPGAVFGGLLALLAGPQLFDVGSYLIGPEETTRTYHSLRQFPGLFITVVFACLMLGRRVEPLRQIWRRAKCQIVMGHIYAWGQYVVGFLVFFALLAAFSDLPALVAPLIAIGFQGGHGTAAGLGDLGGGTSTTASGLMLINVADPKRRTSALSSSTDKQPFYEPLMGGGVVTALALPTVAFWGAKVAFALTSIVLAGWLLMAWRLNNS